MNKLICLIFAILIALTGFSQYDVTWKISTNDFDKPLIPDIPFMLKIDMRNVKSTCEGSYTLEIWDRGNEKEIEKEIENHTTAYPINFIDKFYYPKSRRYINSVYSEKSDEIWFSIPWILKKNNIYSISLHCNKELNDDKIKELLSKIDKQFATEILHQFLEERNDIKDENQKSEFLSHYFSYSLPAIINKKVKSINPKYTYMHNKYNLNWLGKISGILNIIDNDGKRENIDTINNIDFNSLINVKTNGKVKIEIQNAINDIVNDFKSNINTILNNAIQFENIIGTFYSDISIREGSHITYQVGIGYGDPFSYWRTEKFSQPFSSIGINYFFYPINKNIPIRFYENDFWKRFSINAGFTIFDANTNNIFSEKKYTGIFNNQSVTLGLGFLCNDGININIGRAFYFKNSQNPLIVDKSLAGMWKISLDVDRAISSLFKF